MSCERRNTLRYSALRAAFVTSSSLFNSPVLGAEFRHLGFHSNTSSFPRRIGVAGLCSFHFCSAPRGGGAPRGASLEQVALVGRDATLARRGPSRATGTPPRGAPPWRCRPRVRFRLRHCRRTRCEGSTPPGDSARTRPRASRIRGYEPRSTPHPAPPSGSSPEDAPRRAGFIPITLDAIRSQALSSNRDDKFDGLSIVSRARRSMEPIRAFTPVFAGYGGMMRRRTGTVTDTAKSRSLQTPPLQRSRSSGASGTRCGVIRVLSPHTQPLSSRSTSCQITSMPGPLSLRQGMAAKFCPP
jgi:hypothetical protein